MIPATVMAQKPAWLPTQTINYVVGVGTTLMSRLRAGRGNADEAVEALMSAAAQRRAGLFDFHEDELYNLMLYRRRGDELVAGPRVCHEAVVRRGRTWRMDEGHVGAAVWNGLSSSPRHIAVL